MTYTGSSKIKAIIDINLVIQKVVKFVAIKNKSIKSDPLVNK